MTLLVFVATVAVTVWMFIEIPKGFFPQQDTGLHGRAPPKARRMSPSPR